MRAPQNNGQKVYTLLVEYNVRTGLPTGRVKPNDPNDPNYIAPVVDESTCPLPGIYIPATRNVEVDIATGFAVTFSLLFGTANVTRNTAGTWTVEDRTYDGVLFNLTTTPNHYIVRIEYQSGEFKQIATTGIKKIFIPGPFSLITKVSVAADTGDYNVDWNNDFSI